MENGGPGIHRHPKMGHRSHPYRAIRCGPQVGPPTNPALRLLDCLLLKGCLLQLSAGIWIREESLPSRSASSATARTSCRQWRRVAARSNGVSALGCLSLFLPDCVQTVSNPKNLGMAQIQWCADKCLTTGFPEKKIPYLQHCLSPWCKYSPQG